MLAFFKKDGEFQLGIVENNDDPIEVKEVKLGSDISNLTTSLVEHNNIYILSDCSFEIERGEIYRLHKPIYFENEITLTIVEGNQPDILDFICLLSKIDNKYYYVFPEVGRHLIVISDNPVFDTGVYEIGKYYFNRGPALEMAEPPIEYQ